MVAALDATTGATLVIFNTRWATIKWLYNWDISGTINFTRKIRCSRDSPTHGNLYGVGFTQHFKWQEVLMGKNQNTTIWSSGFADKYWLPVSWFLKPRTYPTAGAYSFKTFRFWICHDEKKGISRWSHGNEKSKSPRNLENSGRLSAPHIGPIRVREWPKVSKTGIARGQFWQCGQVAKCPVRRKNLHMLATEHVCTRNRSMNTGLRSAFGALWFTPKNRSALRSTGLFLNMTTPTFSICEGGV